MFMRLAPLLTRSLRAAVSSDGSVCIIQSSIIHCNLVCHYNSVEVSHEVLRRLSTWTFYCGVKGAPLKIILIMLSKFNQ